MQEDNKDIINDIYASIDALALRGNTTRQKAFAAWYATTFLSADEDEVLDLASMDGGEDQGIDLIYVDTTSSQIYVLQSHCPENTTKKTPIVKWDAVVASVAAYETPEIFKTQGRSDIYNHLVSTKEAYKDFDVIFGLVSFGDASKQVQTKLSATKKSPSFNEYDFFYNSAPEIVSKYKSLIEDEDNVTKDEIVFKGPIIQHNDKFGKAWFGTVSAKELIRLHKSYKTELFAGNVRLFIGSRKGSINEQIIKTAKNQPGLFWALNNGISIVANAVEEDGKDKSKLILHRFSIVNGCQTTSCLATAAAENADVLVRVIAASSSVVSDIVRFNNSQNAVKIWAVRSVDETQDHLRKEFKKHSIQYAPKREGLKIKKDAEKIIELDKLTQFLASTKSEFLIQAINSKTELFDQPYQKLFNNQVHATDIHLAWRIGIISDEIRQERAKTLKDQDDKVSNSLLGVSGTYWTIYCANKLIETANNSLSSHLDLSKQISPEFNNALKKYISPALDIYFDTAIDTYDEEEFGSVRSALRSQKFLQKFDKKLNNKIAGKIKSLKLPALVNVLKTIKA